MRTKFDDINTYIASFPKETQKLLEQVRATVREAFKKDLSDYEGAKGSVKFPLDKPIPFDLIGRIVKFRVNESLVK